MRRIALITAWVLISAWIAFSNTANAVDVSTWSELSAALANGTVTEINVLNDITSQANFPILARPGTFLTLNGNGHTLDGASSFFAFYTNMNVLNVNNVTMQNFANNGLGSAIRGYQAALVMNIGPNTAFLNNSSLGQGGAIYNAGSAVNVADGVTFSNNTAGGTFGSGGAIYASNVTIGDNTTFSNNHANGTTNGAGGAINSFDSLVIGDGTTFSNNSATSSGGAISFGTGTMSITPNGGTTLFEGNTANSIPNDIDLFGFNGAPPTTLNINGTSGTVIFDGGISSSFDQEHTAINKTNGGELIFGPNAINSNFLGTFTQTAGTTTYQGEVLGGTNIIDNSNLNLFQMTPTVNINNLQLNNVTLNSINQMINTFNIANFAASGVNNFALDINGDLKTSDQFILASTTGTGILNVDELNVLGALTAQTIELNIFTGDLTGLTFTSSVTEIVTPIFVYTVTPGEDGSLILSRPGGGNEVNKQAFRGQVATLAAYFNQLVVDNILFDHIQLQSETLSASISNNKYAQVYPQFAPYQYTREEGGVWYKAYTTMENLAFTQDLNIRNYNYGSLVGADFEARKLKRGWKLLPTVYVGYNGGHQTFDGVGMYQNGGQGGAMATFLKENFIGSILAYGGGYGNQMNIEGFSDRTGNWFAGAATKMAYNIRASRNYTIQPTALVAYNIFGQQNWGSNFGALSMNSGLLNGIAVAPGLNTIYNQKTWSIYSTLQYIFNINDNLNGSVGPVSLPNISMRHGYIEYGGGVTKLWKERLLGYFQFTLRNGGRTGIGLQAGLTWRF